MKAYAAKKVLDTVEKVQKKADKDEKEIKKWNDLCTGFEEKLTQRALNGIIHLTDCHLC